MSNTTPSNTHGLSGDDVALSDLADHVHRLTQRVEDLEDKLAEKDRRIADLESHRETLEQRFEARQMAQSAIELRGAGSPSEAELGDVWIAGHPIGIMIQNAKDRDRLYRDALLLLAGWDRDIVDDHSGSDLPEGALNDCENAANTTTTTGIEADPDQLLPIHRMTRARTTGAHDLSGNKYRATFVWPAFHSRAVKDQGNWKLSSQQVRNILDEHGLDTNRNTVRRTMQFVAKISSEKPACERRPDDDENLLTLATGGSKLMLVADRDEWTDYMDGVSEHLAAKQRSRQDERLDATESVGNTMMDAQVVEGGDGSADGSEDGPSGEGVTLS